MRPQTHTPPNHQLHHPHTRQHRLLVLPSETIRRLHHQVHDDRTLLRFAHAASPNRANHVYSRPLRPSPAVVLSRQHRSVGSVLVRYRRHMDECLYCDYCSSYVLNTSRHCKQCDR